MKFSLKVKKAIRAAAIGLVLLLAPVSAHAQTKSNPNSQINWPLSTNSGAPTSTCQAAYTGPGTVGYGTPYTDTTGNGTYHCTATGWVKDSGGGGGGSVFVNGGSVSNPNFNNSTPAASAGSSNYAQNVQFQVSAFNISANLPTAIPDGAYFVFTGDSRNVDDTKVIGTPIAISSWSTSGSTLTINTSTAHGLSLGDWIDTRFATSWPACPTGVILGTGCTLFRVTAVNSSTQVTVNVGSFASGSCSSSCGTVQSAMSYMPYAATCSAAMPSWACANTIVLLTSDVTIRGVAAGYSAVLHPYSAAVLSAPVYLIVTGYSNDASICQTYSQIETNYQSIFSQAHTDGDIVVVESEAAANINQQTTGCSPSAYMAWFNVAQWLGQQNKTPASVANSNKYWDMIADAGAVVNDAYNSSLIASNNGFGPAGAKLAANALATTLKTGAGMPLSRVPLFSGDMPENANTAGNGYVFIPSTDSSFTWQFLNSAKTGAPLTLNTFTNPMNVIIGRGLPTRLTINGNTGTSNNFTPMVVINDADGSGVFNSAIKEWLLWNHFTPSANIASNNLIMTLSGDSYSGSGAPAPTAGHAVDWGWSYNNASTASQNAWFLHIAGDTYDSLHAATGGQVCVQVNTAETNTTGQKGCPTTNPFSVGTTGQMNVDASGNTTVATIKMSASYTVSTLPACTSTNAGQKTAVTDATSPTYLGALTGGGTTYAPVLCNGSAWVSD